MGKFIDDLNHLSADVQPMHMDIGHLAKDLDTLAEKTTSMPPRCPAFRDLRITSGISTAIPTRF